MTELKQVSMLLLLVLPLFAGAFLFSYANIRGAQRAQARAYLTENYYMTSEQERQAIMKGYRLTDDEINPTKLLGDFLKGR